MVLNDLLYIVGQIASTCEQEFRLVKVKLTRRC